MSTTDLPRYAARDAVRESAAAETSVADLLRLAVSPLASLRLTVTLLTLSLFLVLAGTLAQIDYDVWEVVHTYFRTWRAKIEVRIFFPRAWDVPDRWFWFPGGKVLGLALAVNLLAAHAVRFKIAAKGGRLFGGVLLIALGAGVTYAVIASGANTAIESELSASFVNGLWHALRASLGASALALAYVLALTWRQSRQAAAGWLWWFAAAAACVMVSLAVYLFTHPEIRLDPSGMRILWQLAKASAAASVLALGCWAVFGKQGGVVLLHSGIALLMFGELYTAEHVVESQMSITEGETATYAQDMRHVELAIVDLSKTAVDRTTTIPEEILLGSLESGQPIRHPELPFVVGVKSYLKNSATRWLQPGEKALATAGVGQVRVAEERSSAKGVDTEQAFDVPAARVHLAADGAPKNAVFLLSPTFIPETIEHDGNSYAVELRYKRIPKRYSVTLINFTFDRYEGTTKAKNYESEVRLQDPAQNLDVTLSAYMNNPIRYAGDTLYQQSFLRDERTTILQVISNAGWMIPYVACVIVGAGMAFHFGLGLWRFKSRQEDDARRRALARGEAAAAAVDEPSRIGRWARIEFWGPAVIIVVFAGWALRAAAPVRESATEMKIHEFGKLPVVYGGRTQPLDSLARNTLRTISHRSEYDDARYEDRQPAVRWLLDVASRAEAFHDHKVLRIENLEVLKVLKLKPREGYRYSVDEVLTEDELARQAQMAAEVDEDRQNLPQKEFLELYKKVNQIRTLLEVFSPPDVGGETMRELAESFRAANERIAQLNQFAPRPVPPAKPGDPWKSLMEATKDDLLASLDPANKAKPEEGAEKLRAILTAYRGGNAQKFNAAVADYQEVIDERAAADRQYERELALEGRTSGRKPAERLVSERIAFEAYFNHFDPFYVCAALYVAAFVLAAAAWLGWFEGFNRAANWLLWFTFALHTVGLVGRIYISGRPPVTNLYSSALFIGWAGVLFALLFEIVYKLGLGNLLAAVLGFPTMLIAWGLTMEGDGDTIGVMQAVLDTNFWLATHVVCMALGYATTFLAGALGMFTILLGLVGGALNDAQRRELTRMTYGSLCFAVFFSFVGTILGGLWADDSWGRFWGWDPKENGALMIVIWNAIVLHARWGKMAHERGIAALAVFGNIVTAWSWFGVNQMGVGLHAYGETPGRSFWVSMFMLSQLAVIAAAYIWPPIQRAFRDDPWPPAGRPA